MTTVTIDNATAGLWEWQGRTSPDWSWTWAEIQEVVQRVNKGATLLDEQNPGWVEKILPEELDMSSAAFCVIGQVYGEYGQYVGIPFGLQASQTDPVAVEHGFLTEVSKDTVVSNIPYGLLDRVWVYMLTERNQQGCPVTLQLGERQAFNVIVDELIRAKLLELRGEELVEVA